MRERAVVVVGRGALGRSLGRALGAELVPGRDVARAWEAPASPPLVLVAVPDGAIGDVARILAGLPHAPETAFAHLSGALTLDVLDPLREAGFDVGSIHPLQPFPSVRPPEAFHDTLFAVDASGDALRDELAALARRLGGRARRVRDAERVRYHAAAVLASADVVAVVSRACAVLGSLGWEEDEALAALLPLIRGSVDALSTRGVAGALSGPMRRGDVTTIQRHLAELADADDELTLDAYRALGRSSLELSRRLGLPEDRAAALEAAFTAS